MKETIVLVAVLLIAVVLIWLQSRPKAWWAELGQHKDLASLKEALLRADVQAYEETDFSFDQIELVVLPTTLYLKTVSVYDLGFRYGAPKESVYDRLNQRGIIKCPPEVAALFLLQGPYTSELPSGCKRVSLYMNPIMSPRQIPVIFSIGKYADGRGWISHTVVLPESILAPDELFLYVDAVVKA